MHLNTLTFRIIKELIEKKDTPSEADNAFKDLIVREDAVEERFPGWARLYFRDEASPESKECVDKYISDREQLNSDWDAFYEKYPGYELILSGDKQ